MGSDDLSELLETMRNEMAGTSVNEADSKAIFAMHARIMALLDWSEAKAWMWLGTQNPMFGGISPAEMIIMGKGEKLDLFVKGAEGEMDFLRKSEKQ